MKFVIKVEGVGHNSQILTLDFNKMRFIDDVRDFIKNTELKVYEKYHGREVFAQYLGSSRIDGHPMFKIDTLPLQREDKISEIIYKK